MATSKAQILSTDEEIDAAIQAANHAPPEPLATRVEFLPALRAMSVHLNTGQRLLLPVEDMQYLSAATEDQLHDAEIVGVGYGIGFPKLDAHFSVEGLLAGRYGNSKWMKQLEKKRVDALSNAA